MASKNSHLAVVVLAAGLGTRMKSSLPKVLHALEERPLIAHALDALSRLRPGRLIVVVGKGGQLVREAMGTFFSARYVEQRTQKGTAHALAASLPALRGFGGTVLVTNGDTPLITPATLRAFLRRHRRSGNAVSLLSFLAEDPTSYGRIVRGKDGRALAVVEEKDASVEECAIREVNSGVYAIEHHALPLLRGIRLNPKKREYYLTDILALALKRGIKADVYAVGDEAEFMGVNTRYDLLRAQETLRLRTVSRLLEAGVRLVDPASVFADSSVRVGAGTLLHPNVHLSGNTVVGKNCIVYPNIRIADSRIADDVVIKDSSVIEHSRVGRGAQIGPFAHLRPLSQIGQDAKVGNFVEVKKTIIGRGSKAMHLSYLGDATLGSGVNVGAGTITCNYDGRKKHKTVIAAGAFIGSASQLVAPVRVGRGAYVGAGSTITHNVPDESLALGRCEQKNLRGWTRRRKD